MEFVKPVWQLLTGILFTTMPLWWIVANRQMDPLLKFLLVVLTNFLFLYLLEFGAHLMSLPQWIPMLVLIVSLVYSGIVLYRQKFRYPWSGILAWFGLAIWILGLQSWIVAYGAASWYGDWYEHYERGIWFLEQQSPQQRFLFEMWPLAARAPLFNAICAFLMNSGDDFASYQVFATLLNTFPVIPLALLFRDVSKLKASTAWIWSILICGIAPFAVQQETYTWTKFFTAGIILAGIYLYRLGLTESRKDIVVLAFCAFALSILSHYLAVLFVIFFAAHFLYMLLKQKWEPKLLLRIIVLSSLILSTWFVYIFAIFGFQGTLQSTSTFGEYGKRQQGSQQEIPPWSIVFAGNMVTSTIPYSWRHDWKDTWRGVGTARRLVQRDLRMGEQFYPSNEELDLKSEWFADIVTKPNSILGAIGFAGMIGLLVAALQRYGKQRKSQGTATSPGKVFWILFFLLGIPLNVFASRDYSAIGMAHLNLQPFFLLIAVLLLREHRSRSLLRGLLILLFVIESALITFAWISLQHRKLPIGVRSDGQVVVSDKVHADSKYVSNYIYKLQTRATYISDHLGNRNIPFFLLTTSLAFCCCYILIRFPTEKQVMS